jgi:hypothetical protein
MIQHPLTGCTLLGGAAPPPGVAPLLPLLACVAGVDAADAVTGFGELVSIGVGFFSSTRITVPLPFVGAGEGASARDSTRILPSNLISVTSIRHRSARSRYICDTHHCHHIINPRK